MQHFTEGSEPRINRSEPPYSGNTAAGRSPYRLLVLLIIIPVYLLLLWLALRPVLAQLIFQSFRKESVISAVSYDGGNATYHYSLGRLYQYQAGSSPDRAIRAYRDSLRLSPLQGGCWLDLAKAYQASGADAEARHAIERATRLLPSNPSVRWEAGVFFLINGDLEKSAKNLKAFLRLSPDRQEDVYDLAWNIPLDPRYVLDNLVPEGYDFYKRYLLYLISAGKVDESGALWQRMKNLEVQPEVVVRYLDFLISGHHYADGEVVWLEYLQGAGSGRKSDEGGMPRNGSFELEILNGGFDWKVQEVKGVDVFIDRDVHMLGEHSLGVTFDGSENPGIVIASQVVRVLPKARYVLSANIKSDSITTTNGVLLAVQGHDCNTISARSEAITGTNFWREVSLIFEVPPECSAVLVKIQRDRSQKLDNKISGSVWIDGMTMVQQ